METGFLFSNIFIVDDDQEFVARARVILESSGYLVRALAEGAAARDEIRQQPPDLLLLAATLPDTDSFAIVRQLKGDAALPFFPVIMLAAPDADMGTALNAGADEFLRKPVAGATLLVRVRAMLRLKRTTEALEELNATLEQKVTERTRQLEDAHARLRHAEKLSALGRLAASVAHDINNPLSGILSYLYLIKYELPEDGSLVRDLGVIERQVNVIASLVQQLQNFSKPPRHKRLAVPLATILQDVLTLLGKDFEKAGIEVICACDESLPPVYVAPDQISEVFMNLLVNARDAMPEGGQVRVEVRPVNGELQICVADTGVGMPPEVKAHLFEPFFTTKGEHGTGLGLAICYRIVQDHGGDIEVESEEGVGTTFTVRLPLENGRSDAEHTAEAV